MNTTTGKTKDTPIPLVEKYRPDTLEEFVGIDTPKRVLSAFALRPRQAAFLLLGPSGVGKTTCAMALAKQVGAEIHHIPSRACDLQSVQKLAYDCHLSPMFAPGGWHMPLIDEADQSSRAAQHAFLSILDATAFPPQTFFVFTANDTSNLEDRFLSRCRTLKFDTDGMMVPALALLKRVWQKEAPVDRRKTPPDFEAMLRETNFNIRECLNILENELDCEGSFKPRAVAPPRSATRQSGDEGEVYTIGYAGMSPARLIKIMERFGIQKVLDCRFKPSTKVPGWSRPALEKMIGDRYQWAGDTLGDQGSTTSEGLRLITNYVAAGTTVLLLSTERTPGTSHRHTDIAAPLMESGIDAQHLFENRDIRELVPASELQATLDNPRYIYKSTGWSL